MAANCQATCGSCSGASSSPSPASPAPTPSSASNAGCMDSGDHCASWASQGYCQSSSYASYMATNCAATCGSCSSSGSSSATSPTPAPTQSHAPAPASSGGPSSATLRAVLDQHNLYRCMHGVNALIWDDAIAAHAQQYATSTGGTMRSSIHMVVWSPDSACRLGTTHRWFGGTLPT